MSKGRGGPRFSEDGNLLTGRKKTGKNPRITFTTTEANKAWIKEQKEKPADYINRLIDTDRHSVGQQEKAWE